MSLSVELSGVQGAQTDINTIGNNIANISTTAFKGATAQFADLYANSLGGGSVPGQGVDTSSLAQHFTQGTINQTGNPLDVAINGNGFFQLQTGSGVAYGRDGSFQIDNSGFLSTGSGARVMGFAPTVGGGTAGGPVQPIQISSANIAASATAKLNFDINLPTGDPAINTTTTPFSATNRASYDESTSASVYDSLGESRTLTTYFTQVSGSGTPNQWQTNWRLTDTGGALVGSGAGPALTFSNTGQLVSGSGTVTVASLPNGAAPLNINLGFTGSTLSNLPFGVSGLTNDGHGGGQFAGVVINPDGSVVGQYSNGATQSFGQIALANFADPQGLSPVTGNLFLSTLASGQPVIGAPSTAGLGGLQSGSLEGSNVDLSTQLVHLIAAQQAYQANVQGISIEQQNITRLLTIQ